MTYSAKAISNYFLDKAVAKCAPLTPMKVQKLVFFGHGWSLGLLDHPLINETVEAWKFGPVIRSLYDEFREFGSSVVTRHARKYKMTDGEIKAIIPRLPEDAVEERALLSRIWDVYHKYTGVQLSNMTHAEGTPWAETVKPYGGHPPLGLDIPDEVIKQYFKRMAMSDE